MWKCRGAGGRELEMNNFNRHATNRTRFEHRRKSCFNEKVVVLKGFQVCRGGCCEMLEKNEHNFPVSKASKTGFSKSCKSCHDARYGKKDDVPDGHQRCMGECGQILKMSEKNFARSGFHPKCRSCCNAEQRFSERQKVQATKKRERPLEDLPDGHQRCMGECGRVLKMSNENFHRNKNARSGFRSTCKTCNNTEKRARKAGKKRLRVEPEHDEGVPVLLRLS